MPQPDLPFYKMNGAGNAILVIDARAGQTPPTGAAARAIARRDGLSFDQLMSVEPSRHAGTDAFVRILNNDGTEAGACGNGTRCVAWVLMQGAPRESLTVETAAGNLVCERLGATRFAVDMGAPRLSWQDIPLAGPVADTRRVPLAARDGLPPELQHCSAVSMGNPHAVFFVPNAGSVALPVIGPAVEHHPVFPDRANVSFVQVLDRDTIRLRVWERSAGATLACGSAACAAVVAAIRDGLTDRRVRVGLPGGELEIAWREADGHVVMAGETELEHAGTLPARLWSSAA